MKSNQKLFEVCPAMEKIKFQSFKIRGKKEKMMDVEILGNHLVEKIFLSEA
jgi:hypothetical protein